METRFLKTKTEPEGPIIVLLVFSCKCVFLLGIQRWGLLWRKQITWRIESSVKCMLYWFGIQATPWIGICAYQGLFFFSSMTRWLLLDHLILLMSVSEKEQDFSCQHSHSCSVCLQTLHEGKNETWRSGLLPGYVGPCVNSGGPSFSRVLLSCGPPGCPNTHSGRLLFIDDDFSDSDSLSFMLWWMNRRNIEGINYHFPLLMP